jgi:hypothetical protein
LNCNRDYDSGERKLANQYIIGKDTVCRVEAANITKNKPAIEFINDILNPLDRFESRLAKQDSKLDEINDKLTRLADNNDRTVTEGSQQGVPDM